MIFGVEAITSCSTLIYKCVTGVLRVPDFHSLVETIDSAQKDISAIATTDIPTMAKIEVLNVDQSLPPDEGELYSREPVPLPKEKVMLRQFDNSHLYEGEGAPSSEDGLEVSRELAPLT